MAIKTLFSSVDDEAIASPPSPSSSSVVPLFSPPPDYLIDGRRSRRERGGGGINLRVKNCSPLHPIYTYTGQTKITRTLELDKTA